MRQSTRLLLFLAILIIAGPSCEKQIKTVETTSNAGSTATDGPIPSYNFDWTSTTYMPSATPPPGVNQVPMPWNSGTTAIDPNLAPDFLPADGWSLVYNTFTPTTQLGDPNYTYFFALYNVYRGLLRFYLWQPASSVATSYINHGLAVYGNSSPMINFNAEDVSNITTPQQSFAEVLNQQINSAQGTWFAFQYEITYDNNVASSTFPNLGLTWNSDWVNVTADSLNGSSTGTITGDVGKAGSTSFPLASLLSTAVVTVLGSLNYATFLGIVGTAVASSAAGNSTNPYTTAVNNGLGGLVKGFFSAILGGSSAGSQQAVNLNINTQIKLTGTSISNGGMVNTKLAIPGQSNSQTADGLTPYFNNVMGVFNLSNAPHVVQNVGYWTISSQDPETGQTTYTPMQENTYQLDPSSFSVNWNPQIINSSPTGATIQNLTYETVVPSYYLYYPEPSAEDQGENDPGFFPFLVQGTGNSEQIGIYSVAVSNPNATSPLIIDFDQDDWNGAVYVGVRMSFDVVPNNGAKKCTIVHTFLAQ
jgi:hypothetical protein